MYPIRPIVNGMAGEVLGVAEGEDNGLNEDDQRERGLNVRIAAGACSSRRLLRSKARKGTWNRTPSPERPAIDVSTREDNKIIYPTSKDKSSVAPESFSDEDASTEAPSSRASSLGDLDSASSRASSLGDLDSNCTDEVNLGRKQARSIPDEPQRKTKTLRPTPAAAPTGIDIGDVPDLDLPDLEEIDFI